jgi:RES domain-containing protein
LPSLTELERFSHASLAQWKAVAKTLDNLSHSLYFGLERHRKEHAGELIEAVRARLGGPFRFDGWARIVSYRHTLEPLSTAGSMKGGGRFNIGSVLNPAIFQPFPALYLAEDLETAFRERFGIERTMRVSGLSVEELALLKPGSFTHVEVRGMIESIFDVGDSDNLRPFADVISKFRMPAIVRALSRKLQLKNPPGLVRTAAMLQRQLLDPNWRLQPIQHDLPSNSQIFGRIAVAAGVHGILFPSSKNSSKRCVALFPQNWTDSESFVEVVGAPPAGTALVRLDGVASLQR